jgi:hypothetical protein
MIGHHLSYCVQPRGVVIEKACENRCRRRPPAKGRPKPAYH